ncbi:hypothetical protein GCM10015535_65060 [Streptomyces gelaticus]|uniref:Uncharacterized protein n=1 Tax=Streptomyces gelaticus TaxID=285446 RepID=A0ABQ2W802_9ACTN|nr:hypothetical protein GCM10015535_65060 [Streptomyces gelaticus]
MAGEVAAEAAKDGVESSRAGASAPAATASAARVSLMGNLPRVEERPVRDAPAAARCPAARHLPKKRLPAHFPDRAVFTAGSLPM